MAKPRNRGEGGGKKAAAKKNAATAANGTTSFPWEATANDDAEEPDGKTARRIAALIEEHKDGPFFIAAGFHKPHVPHTAPKKYFDLYPPNEIALPTEPADHDKQIPAIAQNNKYDHDFTKAQARATISHYFAATTFMDTQVGIVLDALERLDLWKSTIVIFIGDHGWHFGEHHGYWAKGSLFDESARAADRCRTECEGEQRRLGPGRVRRYLSDDHGTRRRADAEQPARGQLCPLLSDPQQSIKKAVFTVVRRGRSLGRAVRHGTVHLHRVARWQCAALRLPQRSEGICQSRLGSPLCSNDHGAERPTQRQPAIGQPGRGFSAISLNDYASAGAPWLAGRCRAFERRMQEFTTMRFFLCCFLPMIVLGFRVVPAAAAAQRRSICFISPPTT